MKNLLRCTLHLVTLTILLLGSVYAQDISGNWQGTLGTGSNKLHIIVELTKAENGGWKAQLFSIDQGTDAIPVGTCEFKDSTLKLAIPAIRGSYEGKLSADGALITGTWTQGKPLPLDLRRATKETAWVRDSSPHSIQFITVEKDVKLEVLDWGGSGRPLVMLTGLGNNGHVFDKFALKLTGSYHVYGISRRGFGASSKPDFGYSADRLGDDVLAVLDALKLTRPILAGHSIAGQELSSIGSRHPDKVAGLIYLDAAYGYAYHDSSHPFMFVEYADLQRKMDQLIQGKTSDPKKLIRELRETSLPAFERGLKEYQEQLDAMPPAEYARMRAQMASMSSVIGPAMAIMSSEQKYTDIRSPILAIFALPKVTDSYRLASVQAQAKALETGIPTARVVRIADADHYVFLSHEADVLREMNAFIATLPK